MGVVAFAEGKPAEKESKKESLVKQVVFLNTLASGCYATQAQANEAFENAMTEQKHCHFVDMDASYVDSNEPSGPGDIPPPPPRWCMRVMGW